MIEEVDIWRSANLLIKKHGSDATLRAAQRADELLARGDIDGHMTWQRILKAVEEMLSTEHSGPVN